MHTPWSQLLGGRATAIGVTPDRVFVGFLKLLLGVVMILNTKIALNI